MSEVRAFEWSYGAWMEVVILQPRVYISRQDVMNVRTWSQLSRCKKLRVDVAKLKIPEDDGNDLMHTFFNPDKEGWLWKQGGR